MNKKFDQFLVMLESKASTPERKADLRAARELYHKGALTEALWFDRPHVARGGLTDWLTSWRDKSNAKYNDTKAPEIKERDDKFAEHINNVDANLSQASKLVVDAAKLNPGQVDAWVDCRLKPAIKRTLNDDSGFLTSDAKKTAYKAEKKKFVDIYTKADKSDERVWKDKMADSLKKADEEEAYKREQKEFDDQQAERQKNEELAKKGEEKIAALDPKKEGHTAQDPVNGTDLDTNHRVSQARSDEFNKREEDRKKVNIAGDDGSTLNIDNITNSGFFELPESVSTKNLRAAFESVYGSSRGYTDKEIRLICESCYRRTKK